MPKKSDVSSPKETSILWFIENKEETVEEKKILTILVKCRFFSCISPKIHYNLNIRNLFLEKLKMEIRKIVKFEKHDENSYSVWYEHFTASRVCLTKAHFELAQCIDEFLRRAIDPDDVRRIVELSSRVALGDFEENSD